MLFLTDSAKKIGVSATDSLMLSPTKSVTAIVAIGE
jgi:cobalamin-dependent methionine synthase I